MDADRLEVVLAGGGEGQLAVADDGAYRLLRRTDGEMREVVGVVREIVVR